METSMNRFSLYIDEYISVAIPLIVLIYEFVNGLTWEGVVLLVCIVAFHFLKNLIPKKQKFLEIRIEDFEKNNEILLTNEANIKELKKELENRITSLSNQIKMNHHYGNGN